MKKQIIKLIAALIVSVSLASCSQTENAGTSKGDSEATGQIHSEAVGQPGSETDGRTSMDSAKDMQGVKKMDIESYMQYFVNYFHEPYQKGNDLEKIDLLDLSFFFCFSHKESLDFIKITDTRLEIKGEGIRKIAKNLFGENVNLSDYHHFLETSVDLYAKDSDKYIVQYAKGYWGGELYYIDEEAPTKITETDDTLTFTANVYYDPTIGKKENIRKMEYHFEKVTDNGFLYYQISEIKLVK